MGTWLTWAIFGLLLIGIEIVTPSFFVICFAIGALAASVMAALGYSLVVQLLAFLVATLICLAILQKYTTKKRSVRQTETNYRALIGQTGVVTETILAQTGLGQIKVLGEYWSAQADTKADIHLGEKVKVVAVSGVRLIVRQAEGDHT